MSEINVKISGIEDAITKLQNLQKQSASIGIAKPATVGGGEVVGYLEEIAENKAGIIKPGCAVISARQKDSVSGILRSRADKYGCSYVQAEPELAEIEKED